MADNFTTPVPSGTSFASKDIGGVQHPRNLIVDEAGADAVGAVGATPGANTILGRLKAIADELGNLPAAGDATAANQATMIAALADIVAALSTALEVTGPLTSAQLAAASLATSAKQDAIVNAIEGAEFYPATQPVSGTVGVSGPVAVTGTFFQETQPISATVLPLPTGAATAAKQDQIIAPLDAMAATAAPFDITPHASDPLAREIKALSITTAGTVVFRYPGEGSDRTVTLPAGFFPLRATHIRATSTATGLTGF